MTQARKSSYPSADQFPTQLKFQARNLPVQNVPVSQIVDSVPTHRLWPQNLEIWQSTQNHTAFLLINWYNPRFLAGRVKRTTRRAKEKEHRSPLEKYQPSETGLSPDGPSRGRTLYMMSFSSKTPRRPLAMDARAMYEIRQQNHRLLLRMIFFFVIKSSVCIGVAVRPKLGLARV